MFVANFGYIKVYPLKNNGDAYMAMSRYFKDAYMPTYLHMEMLNRWA